MLYDCNKRRQKVATKESLGHMRPKGWLSNDTNVGMARKKSSYSYNKTKTTITVQ